MDYEFAPTNFFDGCSVEMGYSRFYDSLLYKQAGKNRKRGRFHHASAASESTLPHLSCVHPFNHPFIYCVGVNRVKGVMASGGQGTNVPKRKPVFITVNQLQPGTWGHNLTVKVCGPLAPPMRCLPGQQGNRERIVRSAGHE